MCARAANRYTVVALLTPQVSLSRACADDDGDEENGVWPEFVRAPRRGSTAHSTASAISLDVADAADMHAHGEDDGDEEVVEAHEDAMATEMEIEADVEEEEGGTEDDHGPPAIAPPDAWTPRRLRHLGALSHGSTEAAQLQAAMRASRRSM